MPAWNPQTPDGPPEQRPQPEPAGYTYRPEDFPFGGYPGADAPLPPAATPTVPVGGPANGYPPPPDYPPPAYPPPSAASLSPGTFSTRYPGGYPAAPPEGQYSRPGGTWRPASMGNRALAKLIDGLIVGVPFAFLYAWAYNNGNESAQTWISVATTVATIMYETYFISTKGTTIGKQARGIRVLNERTGAMLTPTKAFQRSIVQFLSNYALFAGWWSPLLDRPKLRGWHDKAAGDVVVTDR